MAFTGLDKLTMMVSSVSTIASSTMLAIVMLPDVSPASMVNVPSASV